MWRSERRAVPRVRFTGCVVLEADGDQFRAWGLNVSECGILVHGRCAQELQAGQQVKVSFRVPEAARAVESAAQVVDGREGSRLGLRFVSFQPRSQSMLSRYVSTAGARERQRYSWT